MALDRTMFPPRVQGGWGTTDGNVWPTQAEAIAAQNKISFDEMRAKDKRPWH